MDLDTIFLRDLHFHVRHGVYSQEKTNAQTFVVNIEMGTNTLAASCSDALNDTVDYSKVYTLTKEVMTGATANLVEYLGHQIAERILNNFPTVESVTVEVHKPEVAIPDSVGKIGTMGVKLTRTRQQMESLALNAKSNT